MITDLYAATPPLWDTGELQVMGRNVGRWLRENHPGLNEQARAAVAKVYTYDYK